MKNVQRKSQPWSDQDVEKLQQLRDDHYPLRHISAVLGRSIDSVKQKSRELRSLKGSRNAVIQLSDSDFAEVTRDWTFNEERALFEMRRMGIPYKLIATDLKRSEQSVRSKFRSTDWSKHRKPHHDGQDRLFEKSKETIQEKIAQAQDRRLHVYRAGADIIADKLVAAIRAHPEIKPPTYRPKRIRKKHQDQDVVVVVSDIHIGACHSFEETGGLSQFNEQVLLKRLDNLRLGVRDIYELHSLECELPTLHVACLGDIVAGMNNAGAWSQNYINMPIFDQVARGWSELDKLLTYWLSIFPNIVFYGVRGNHGRVAPKGVEKDYVNWDLLCYTFLKTKFENNPRIKFVIPKTWWILEEIRGHNFLMVHGDDIRSKGFPVKGLADFEQKMATIIKTVPDYTLAGHFHTSCELQTNNGRCIVNGSIIGGDVYSIKDIHAAAKPEQTIFGVHNDHGITWKYNLNLDRNRDPD